MKIKTVIFILVLLLMGGTFFYWYEWRPTQIRKECGKSDDAFIPALYQKCLHEKGIER